MTRPLPNRKINQNWSFWTTIGFALLFPSFATWLYFMVLSGSTAMATVYSACKVFQFSLPVIIVGLVYRERIRMFRGGVKGTVTGLVFGCLAGLSILWLYLVLLKDSPVFALFGDRLTEKLEGFGATTPLRYVVLAIFISLFHSLLEEYYWRWFIFGELRKRLPLWLSYLVASLGFAAHHVLVVLAYFGMEQWPWVVFFSTGVAVGGAVWCWMYDRYDSLFAPWISHLVIDAALLAIGALHLWG